VGRSNVGGDLGAENGAVLVREKRKWKPAWMRASTICATAAEKLENCRWTPGSPAERTV
jgi:hypothetical protein